MHLVFSKFVLFCRRIIYSVNKPSDKYVGDNDMTEYEVQYYSNYHKTDLERESNKKREVSRLNSNEKQVERKGHNPVLLLLMNMFKL